MTKFKNKYRIESNRWKYWDYSAPGQYFLTVCIQGRECILGNVVHGEMKLSSSGEIVKSEIEKIPGYHKRIILGEWIVMPNHIHLIVELGDYDFDNGICDGGNGGGDRADDVMDNVEKIHVEEIHEFPLHEFSLPDHPKQWWYISNHQPTDNEIKQYRKFRRQMIIPKIMGKMKMVTSKHINIEQNTPGKKNWQKDYHDHVIRNEKSYNNISNYIQNNPSRWQQDTFHPKNPNSDN